MADGTPTSVPYTTTKKPTQKRREVAIPHGLPVQLDTMIRTCEMLSRAMEMDIEHEEAARNAVGAAWVKIQANERDERYKLLLMLADALDKPALRVHRAFAPETVREAAMRLLRVLKKRSDEATLKYFIATANRLEMIGTRDAIDLL